MTDEELQAIKQRWEHNTNRWHAPRTDVPALVAEVERLKAQLDDEGIARTLAELGAQLAAVTAERDALRSDKQYIDQALANLPDNIGKLVMIEYWRLKHKEVTQ